MTAKLCPMLKCDMFTKVEVDGREVITYLDQCLKENCAWWCDFSYKCAIFEIALGVSNLLDVAKDMRNRNL